MSYITSVLIPILARFLVGTHVFDRIKASVIRWEAKELAHLPGAAKQQGVLHEIRDWGIKAATWQLTAAIDLAVVLLRMQAGEEIQ